MGCEGRGHEGRGQTTFTQSSGRLRCAERAVVSLVGQEGIVENVI